MRKETGSSIRAGWQDSARPQQVTFDGHGRLIFAIPANVPASRPLLLKFEPTDQVPGAVTMSLDTWSDYLRDDASWLVFSTACFAIMLTMALMALCFTLILRDMTFGWYAAYLVCYALIQGLRSGYVFHPLELQALAGLSDSLGTASTALSVSFAALFMLRFCKVDDYVPLLRTPVVAFAIGMFRPGWPRAWAGRTNAASAPAPAAH